MPPLWSADAEIDNRSSRAQLTHVFHEALHAVPIDRVPGDAVDLEMRADHSPVADPQDVRDGIDIDAGVGEYGRAGHRVLDDREVRSLYALAGHRAGDEHHIGERG